MKHKQQQQLWSVTIVITTFILLLLLCSVPVTAIGVTGAKYTGSISPGGTDTHVMTISIGAGEQATDMTVDVAGFGQSPSGSYIPMNAGNDVNPYSARNFISLDNTTLHLEPGTAQTVTATITLPQNVGAGGRYALIYIHPPSTTRTSISAAILVPVFITVAGTTSTETGSILKIDTGSVIIGQPITITTSFENTGNYHYYGVSNEVTVIDSNGALLANTSTIPMPQALIPGNTVQFVTQPKVTNLPIGTYTVDSKVLQGGQILDEKNTTFTISANYIPPTNVSSITVSPAGPAALTSSDGRYSVSFPQGAVLGNVVVTLSPYAIDKLSPAPSSARLGATSFAINGLSGLLNKAATVKVIYSADDLSAAGGDASKLKLSYFDPSQGAWVIMPTQVNKQDTTLTATTNQLGIFVVMVSSSTNAKTPLPVVLSIGAIAATAIIFSSKARRRQ